MSVRREMIDQGIAPNRLVTQGHATASRSRTTQTLRTEAELAGLRSYCPTPRETYRFVASRDLGAADWG